METIIRPLEKKDVGAVLEMLREFAAHEGLSQHCTIDETRLTSALFGDGAFVDGLVADQDGTLIGYTLFFPYFSSFRGECGLYVDDLYLSPDARSSGLGKRLLTAVAQRAAGLGYERIDFLVQDENESAIRFYERLGARQNAGEGHFKIAGPSFRKLAMIED